MTDSPAARPIWLTEDQARAITRLLIDLDQTGYNQTHLTWPVGEIVNAWHRAPADATEAVKAAISSEWMSTGMGNEERIDEVYNREGAAIYRTRAVLAALGAPTA